MKIPPITRKEWRKLLNGELDVSLRNFFFQMKVTQARTQINNGTVSIETAINDLHILCTKFSKAKNMDEDMKSIFGADYMDEKEPIPVHFDLQKDIDIKNIFSSLRYEREILFYKKALEKKENIVQEKNNLIVTLQEEVIFLKEKVSILYEGLKEIEAIKEEGEYVVVEEKVKKEEKTWSFFNIFKK